MYKKILVPLDGSDLAEKVVRGTIKPVLLIRAIPVVPRQVDWRESASTPGAMAS